jgi:hypothetical protein
MPVPILDPADLTQAIVNAALKPEEMSGDAGSIKQRSIDELIAADKYAKTQTAASKPMGGIRLNRVIPSGST